jgi:hypothetical protein
LIFAVGVIRGRSDPVHFDLVVLHFVALAAALPEAGPVDDGDRAAVILD